MGSIFRRYTCTGCKAKYSNKPKECRCGNTSFSEPPWTVQYYVNGKCIQRSAKGMTKFQAKRWLASLEAEAAQGNMGMIQEKRITLRDYIDSRYWPLHGCKLNSARNYRYNIDAHVIPTFGDKLLHRINEADVVGWRNNLLDQDMKPSSTNRLVDLLSGIYTRANKWNDTRNHPVKGLERLSECNERGDEYYLTPNQYQLMMSLTDNELLKAAITLAIGTCLRKDNLFGLRWDKHVDMLRGRITIPGTESKNKEPVIIPIIGLIHETLEGLPRGLHSPYVLTSSRGDKFSSYMHSQWRALRDKVADSDALFPADFHWHDLRATGASWLIQAGVPERTVMRIMNLKSTRVLKRYEHMTYDHLREEMVKVERNFTTGKSLDRTQSG